MMSEIDFGTSKDGSDLDSILGEFKADVASKEQLEPGQTEALVYDLLGKFLGCQEGRPISVFSEEERREAVKKVSTVVGRILEIYPQHRGSFEGYNETQKRSGRPDLVLNISIGKVKDR